MASLLQEFRRSLRQFLVTNTLIGIGVTIVSLAFAPEQDLAWRRGLSSLVVSFAVGFPAQLFLPRVGPYAWQLGRAKGLAVVALCGALVGLSGAAVGSLVVMPLYLLPLSKYPVIFTAIARISVTVTVAISVISSYLGRLQSQLERARAERARAEKQALEAQLASLESRLHPHFLFNTLNSISALIPESPARAERMVEQIAALLRQSLDMGPSTMVPLERELKLVRDYLEIEQARFGSRLSFTFDVTSEAMGDLVPAFALQLLVENSVKHAVSPSRAGAAIRVEGVEEGGRLLLRVRDSGPGFGSSDLKAGHGLDTLRARLQTLYGDAAALEIGEGEGALVTLRLPARRAVVAA